MKKLALLLILAVGVGGCWLTNPKLSPNQQAEMRGLMNHTVACGGLETVIRSLTFQKKLGHITVPQDKKILAVLDQTDVWCAPGGAPSASLSDNLRAMRGYLLELQAMEQEARK